MRVKHKTQGWFKFFCMINSRSDLLAKQKLETSIFIKQERRKRERRKIEIGRIRVES
jgi:hypothetical protein